jgi:predicted nucleic acid-binding protein
VTVGFDTNIFIYSFDRSDADKNRRAQELLRAILSREASLPLQLLGEALNAAARKRHLSVPDAREACALLIESAEIVGAEPDDVLRASLIGERYRLQYFDAQMIAVCARIGITVLLSEDMQDGAQVGTVRIINPFVGANIGLIDELLFT